MLDYYWDGCRMNELLSINKLHSIKKIEGAPNLRFLRSIYRYTKNRWTWTPHIQQVLSVITISLVVTQDSLVNFHIAMEVRSVSFKWCYIQVEYAAKDILTASIFKLHFSIGAQWGKCNVMVVHKSQRKSERKANNSKKT